MSKLDWSPLYIGARFGDWEVLDLTENKKRVLCKCHRCNKEYLVYKYNLIGNKSTKCRKCGTKLFGIEIEEQKYLYRLWKSLGDKDESWSDFWPFHNSVAPRPAGLFLQKIDPSKPYGKTNFKWAKGLQGPRKYITVDGKRFSIAEWARIIGITRQGLAYRRRIKSQSIKDIALDRGVDLEALSS